VREIKFRVWDNKHNVMVTENNAQELVEKYDSVDDDDYYTDEWYPYCNMYIPFGIFLKKDKIIMQYTGLKDKNGVEIYEGDIINLHYTYEGYDDETFGAIELEDDIKGVVELETSLGLYINTGDDKQNYIWEYLRYIPLSDYSEQIEVIGNIYENENLLEVEEDE